LLSPALTGLLSQVSTVVVFLFFTAFIYLINLSQALLHAWYPIVKGLLLSFLKAGSDNQLSYVWWERQEK